jgi:hypothetical protein
MREGGKTMNDQIYLIVAENGLFKIGITGNISQRYQTLKNACPCQLELFLWVEGDKNIEKELLVKFAKKRIRGEWFALDKEDLLQVLCHLQPVIDDNIKQYITQAVQYLDEWGFFELGRLKLRNENINRALTVLSRTMDVPNIINAKPELIAHQFSNMVVSNGGGVFVINKQEVAGE